MQTLPSLSQRPSASTIAIRTSPTHTSRTGDQENKTGSEYSTSVDSVPYTYKEVVIYSSASRIVPAMRDF